MVKEIKCKLKGKYYEIGFHNQTFKVPKEFLDAYRKQVEGFEIFKINELIEKEAKELKKVDNKIPDKFKELIDNETNQHMRLTASLAILKDIKEQLNLLK